MPRTIRIVQILLILAVLPATVQAKPHKTPVKAEMSHRAIGSWFAETLANNAIRDRLCGGHGYKCLGVSAGSSRCGYHSYCWSGWTHRECRAFWGQCIGGHIWRYTAGTVNGHTGYVTITRGTT